MSLPEPQPTAIDCIFENILGFMLPFFLSSAGGDADLARAAIQELAEAYNAASATELELVGRILGFSTVAMDNLRLSMNPEMSDTKVLRYRSNAVALSRAGEQCRKILEVMQANRKPAQKPMTIPAPAIAAASPIALQAKPNHAAENKQRPQPPASHAVASQSQIGGMSMFPENFEAMKRDARAMLSAFSKSSGASAQPTAIFPQIQDPATLVGAAVRQAITSSRRIPAA